jgi:hypothetical protein
LTTSAHTNRRHLPLAPQGRLDYSRTSQKDVLFFPLHCERNAPFAAHQIQGGHWKIQQTCCDSWNCERCGLIRARHEYGRIVEGCRALAVEHDLYFLTITCKGRHLSLRDAMKGYLAWTNVLFSALRADAKKRGILWSYVQVTEQQGRGHPHSHVITTYAPDDLTHGTRWSWSTDTAGNRTRIYKDCWRSEYLQTRVKSSGLGEQYDLSPIRTVEGASRYAAKYLFDKSMFTQVYPKSWKRVRYGQSFPKAPIFESNALPLITRNDWIALAKVASRVDCAGEGAFYDAQHFLRGSDTFVTICDDLPQTGEPTMSVE